MVPIFESILPIFLLVAFGAALKRSHLMDEGLWPGLETLGYYVLFPSLLFLTLAKADFIGLDLGLIGLVAISAVMVMTVVLIALYPALSARGVSNSSYTSVFQTASRWNAFIALAIAERLSGATGLALVALVMALIILPLNLVNVGVLVWFGGGRRSLGSFLKRIAGNPLVIGCAAGLVVGALPYGLYGPIEETIDLVARASLGLGLIMVGAGLRVADALKPRPAALLATGLKLVLFPAIMMGLCLLAGIRGDTLVLLALCASVPTAMNGYLLARQMGGDAPLYAAVATLQTVASFVTIPAVVAIATRLGQ